MQKDSIIVDVAIDQGGSVETIDHATTHENPTFRVHNVIHYSVANMTGAVPKISTIALTNATIQYVIEIANNDIKKLIKSNEQIKKGIQTIEGKLVFKGVADAHGMSLTDIDKI